MYAANKDSRYRGRVYGRKKFELAQGVGRLMPDVLTVTLDEISYALADHDDRGVCVCSHTVRDNRCVRYSKSVDAFNTAVLVNHS